MPKTVAMDALPSGAVHVTVSPQRKVRRPLRSACPVLLARVTRAFWRASPSTASSPTSSPAA
eukprot:3150678-Pleurochrysis_carterae.AAC.2